MYRLTIPVLVSACFLWAQPVDPFDSVLVTYYLTQQQEAQFSRTDGVLSSFWDDWSGRDSIAMTPARNGHPDFDTNWSGPGDAGLVVKAAATERGLYLCYVVTDDAWVSGSYGDALKSDVLSFYLDSSSSATLDSICVDTSVWQCPWLASWGDTLSIGAEQQWASVGDDTLPGLLQVANYRGIMAEWNPFVVDLATASQPVIGIEAEPVWVDDVTRAWEFCLTWTWLDIPEDTPLAGSKFASSFGYSDADDTASGSPFGQLWWQRAEPRVGLAYWGDLLMADDVPPVEPWQRVRQPERVQPQRQSPAAAEAYDLRGRLLIAHASASHGVTLLGAGEVGRAVVHLSVR